VRRQADKDKAAGVFLAVPERSWHPLKVERVQTETVKIGEAPAPREVAKPVLETDAA
jgi:hypothetical protein